jgi:hypothetical protein
VIPSKEIPFFGEAHQRFWAIIAKFGFFGVIRMARIAKFGYSVHPNNRITEYLVIWVTRITEFGDSVFSVSFRSSGKLASFAQNRIQLIRALVNPFVDPFVRKF